MTAQELRNMYTEFFKERGHQVIASASLLPDNDPTVLFTTAGMHPLVPYLLGERHPLGRRLTDVQKCVRTCDIDEVGDDTHLTFFEMLGNWSLGDYSKKESITFSYEFLTDCLQIPASRIAVTVFQGDGQIPRDEEAADIWKSKGLTENQIFYYGGEENWWGPAGQTGPCGPDTEIFFNTGKEPCGKDCGPACSCGKYVEIWNNVFMEYNKEADGSYRPLSQRNVDTGMGLERVLTVLNGKADVYETELFIPVMEKLKSLSKIPCLETTKGTFRIICEHVRAMTFILGDPKGITPSNTEQGYILRRLIRRAIRLLRKLELPPESLCTLAEVIILQYQDTYPELEANGSFILAQLEKEYRLFDRTLEGGLKKADQYLSVVPEGGELKGELAFKLYDTYGFPLEFTIELAKERGIAVDTKGFEENTRIHQEKSRKGGEIKFRGGLADNSVYTARLHTATHLLQAALRMVLGDSICQRGSNITNERLRFDFSFQRKLTEEELERVSDIVNAAIAAKLEVICSEMSPEAAKAAGAIGLFDSKYGEKVKVYTIPGYSMEICGGPHAGNTEELGRFTIIKEEASSAGVRRIKAILH